MYSPRAVWLVASNRRPGRHPVKGNSGSNRNHSGSRALSNTRLTSAYRSRQGLRDSFRNRDVELLRRARRRNPTRSVRVVVFLNASPFSRHVKHRELHAT